jgi:hypothetical protein
MVTVYEKLKEIR